MDTREFRMQKDELVRALRNLSPAITMRGQGNESLIGIEFRPGGVVMIKAGANLTRTRTTIVWSGEELAETIRFSIESYYLANALRTLGIASEVRLKWRPDNRIEFFLPGGKGAHVIPIQEDEFQEIEETTKDAEVLFDETRNMELMDSVLKRVMTMWGLVSSSEREVSQMIVLDGVFTVCTPGFYFIEKVVGFPDNFRVHPQVAERTQRFIDCWKGHEVQFQILRTKRWSQTWGLLTVKVGATKDGATNSGAMWLFSVEISDESHDSLNATILRMKEDMASKVNEGMLKLIVSDASLLAAQIAAATAVTEDTHVLGSVHSSKGIVALVLASKNAMAAHSSMGVPIVAEEVPDEINGKDIIEWKVSLVKTILSAFGKNRIMLYFDPASKRTFFTEYATGEETLVKEAFMNHVGRQLAPKVYPPKKGAPVEGSVPKAKRSRKSAIVVGGTEEGLAEIMDSILNDPVKS